MALPPARVLKTLSQMEAGDLFSVRADFPLGSFFPKDAKPWEWLPRIAEALQSLGGSSHLPKGIPPGCHISRTGLCASFGEVAGILRGGGTCVFWMRVWKFVRVLICGAR